MALCFLARTSQALVRDPYFKTSPLLLESSPHSSALFCCFSSQVLKNLVLQGYCSVLCSLLPSRSPPLSHLQHAEASAVPRLQHTPPRRGTLFLGNDTHFAFLTPVHTSNLSAEWLPPGGAPSRSRCACSSLLPGVHCAHHPTVMGQQCLLSASAQQPRGSPGVQQKEDNDKQVKQANEQGNAICDKNWKRRGHRDGK